MNGKKRLFDNLTNEVLSLRYKVAHPATYTLHDLKGFAVRLHSLEKRAGMLDGWRLDPCRSW